MGKVNKVTKEERDKYIIDYQNGMSCTEIGKKYYRNASTIERNLKSQNIFVSSANLISEDEFKLIIQDYKLGMNCNELADKYKRNSSSLRDKLIKNNIYIFPEHLEKLSDEDIEFLKIYYSTGDWDIIFKRFPNSNKQQIYSQMSELNIKMDSYFWSDYEVQILKDNYENMGGNIKKLILLFNNKFTYTAICSKAEKIGLKTKERWSETETQIIIDNYGIKSLDEIMLLLPTRTRVSITSQAWLLGIRSVTKYSKEQEQFIIDNWKQMSDKELAIHIDKTDRSVIGKRLMLGFLRIDDKSSYNDLSEYIRRNNLEWKKESTKQCGFKCYFSGERFQAIHHIQGLNLILNETLEELDIVVKESMDDYTKEELRAILDTFRINQNKYPLGICLQSKIHKLFHNIYGYGYNTPNQWYEFENNYKSGALTA